MLCAACAMMWLQLREASGRRCEDCEDGREPAVLQMWLPRAVRLCFDTWSADVAVCFVGRCSVQNPPPLPKSNRPGMLWHRRVDPLEV